MVDQGGAGGAYESGGFDPNNVYNNDAANAAIMSFGKIIGAGLTAAGKDKEKEKPKDKIKKPEISTSASEDAQTFETFKEESRQAKETTAALNKQLGGLWKR